MASQHTVADDIVYDIVSIQYHALKGAELYSKFLGDAHAADHPDVRQFIERCQQEDNDRARRCHELLIGLTSDGGIG